MTSSASHQVRRYEERLASGSRWADEDLVFATVDGGLRDGPHVTRRLQLGLTRAGVRRARIHDLRHSAASFLLSRGVRITANLCSHVAPELTRDATDRLQTLLGWSLPRRHAVRLLSNRESYGPG
jgi:integrase